MASDNTVTETANIAGGNATADDGPILWKQEIKPVNPIEDDRTTKEVIESALQKLRQGQQELLQGAQNSLSEAPQYKHRPRPAKSSPLEARIVAEAVHHDFVNQNRDAVLKVCELEMEIAEFKKRYEAVMEQAENCVSEVFISDAEVKDCNLTHTIIDCEIGYVQETAGQPYEKGMLLVIQHELHPPKDKDLRIKHAEVEVHVAGGLILTLYPNTYEDRAAQADESRALTIGITLGYPPYVSTNVGYETRGSYTSESFRTIQGAGLQREFAEFRLTENKAKSGVHKTFRSVLLVKFQGNPHTIQVNTKVNGALSCNFTNILASREFVSEGEMTFHRKNRGHRPGNVDLKQDAQFFITMEDFDQMKHLVSRGAWE